MSDPPADAAVAASILVPVFNEERYIEASVEAMRRQRFDGELEFVFADGRSTDRTREILERLAADDPRVRVFDNPLRTVSTGLNVTLANARGRWAARMDAHTIYPDDYVALGVTRLAAGDTRWVSGPQLPVGSGVVSRAVAVALSDPMGRGGSRKWGGRGERAATEYDLDTGVFAGVWERATLLEYDGWDEQWSRNSDSEMAARFLANGERLVCLPAMGAEYVPRDSLGGLWRQYRDYGRYRARTARRHPHSLRASHLLAPGIVATGVSAVVAPHRLRRVARGGLAVYLSSLGLTGIRTRRAAESPTEAALVPVVLAIMHVGHGVGQLHGWLRHGVPVAALRHVARTTTRAQHATTQHATTPDARNGGR